MRFEPLFFFSAAILINACASTPEADRATRPACDPTSNCFYERSIRNYRVLDDRTIVVLVGRDQCPYRVELDGFFCDIAMSSFIAFDDTDGRICTWDRANVVSGPFVSDREYCRVRGVSAMTDDELLEAYADSGFTAPPPATGSGEIEVVEDQAAEAGGGDAVEGSDSAAEHEAGEGISTDGSER
jgi:hypothetical protein